MIERKEKTFSRALHLGRLALQFARVERVTKHEDGVRPETDADHTVMLGLIACDFAPAHLNRELVAAFSLAHDFVEVYAGDTQTLKISVGQRKSKEDKEAAAHKRLETELGRDAWLCVMIARYEAQTEPEARFVRLLDKVMPKITHALNGCVAAKALVNAEGFLDAHQKQYAALAERYPEFPETLALLKESMEAAEACWSCAVCGEPTEMHIDGKAPGQVYVDGIGVQPCQAIHDQRSVTSSGPPGICADGS